VKSVLFINYEYPPVGAGAATATFHLATELANHNINTSVVSSAYKGLRGVCRERNLTVYRINALRKHTGQSSLTQMVAFIISAVLHLPKILSSTRPDVTILFFSFPCGPLGLYMRLLWKIPYVVMLRGGDVPGSDRSLDLLHRFLKPLRKVIYLHSRCIIANSVSLQNLALKSDPYVTIDVVRNGVDTLQFTPSNRPADNATPFSFLFTGRLCAQKNLHVLLDAFAHCYTKDSSISLTIAGDGPLREELVAQAGALGIFNAVHWSGWCNRQALVSLYQSAHCFVIPSLNEGMSNSILEAMSCGLAILAGDCDANRELIAGTTCGMLFNPLDTQALADRMLYYRDNRAVCSEHGSNGRARCLEKHSWTASGQTLLSIIKSHSQPRKTSEHR